MPNAKHLDPVSFGEPNKRLFTNIISWTLCPLGFWCNLSPYCKYLQNYMYALWVEGDLHSMYVVRTAYIGRGLVLDPQEEIWD